ncbi:MAG: prepilin peptidase [Syntrophomonas sp.]
MLTDIILLGLVSAATIFDIKENKIPNQIIIIGLLVAFFYSYYSGNYTGILFSLKGFALGMGLLIIPYFLGGLGAGDVKLLGMVGALKGCTFVLNTCLWMAIFGGFIAIAILLRRQLQKDTFMTFVRRLLLSVQGVVNTSDLINKDDLTICFPYGVAIALGVVATYFKGWW